MRFDDVVGAVALVAHGLGFVVVEHEVRARHIGQVGGDVTAGDGHLAVLHVLGMDEGDLVDQIQLIEQHRADQAVKVTAGHQAVFRITHSILLVMWRTATW